MIFDIDIATGLIWLIALMISGFVLIGGYKIATEK